MGASSIRSEDEQPKSWLRQTGETALKTADALCDFKAMIVVVGAANLMRYQVDVAKLIEIFKYTSAVQFFVGIMTQNNNRISSSVQNETAAILMSLARKDCWASTLQDSLRSAAGLGLFVQNPSRNVQFPLVGII